MIVYMLIPFQVDAFFRSRGNGIVPMPKELETIQEFWIRIRGHFNKIAIRFITDAGYVIRRSKHGPPRATARRTDINEGSHKL